MPKKSPLITVKRAVLDNHRKAWAKVAKKHGWYVEPFFVQFWIYSDGTIQDCVSFRDMKADIFVLVEGDDVTEIAVIEPRIV